MRRRQRKGKSRKLDSSKNRSRRLLRRSDEPGSIKLDFTDDDIQTIFEFDPLRGFRAMDQFRRLEIGGRCYWGGNRQLSFEDLLDAYQETMIEVYLTIAFKRRTIRNILAFTYDVAWKRGFDVNRKRFRRDKRVRATSDLDPVSAPLSDDEDEARQVRRMRLIRRQLDKLEGEEAVIAEHLWPQEGPSLSEAETAKRIGMSKSTLNRRKAAIVEKLRDSLEGKGSDGGN